MCFLYLRLKSTFLSDLPVFLVQAFPETCWHPVPYSPETPRVKMPPAQ